ncbi:MAG: hypothetical protein HQL11_02590, partial [Candidatus Omnitrophica bacterium]|nr:hypothetical protein [Candidatus Omnitrophota bacterium]
GKGSRLPFTLPLYTPEHFVEAYLEEGIRRSTKDSRPVSLLVIHAESPPPASANETISGILSETRAFAERSLRDASAVMLEESREIVVLLHGCAAEDVLKVRSRLQEGLSAYFRAKSWAESLRFRYGHASYPQDAENARGLLERARRR